MNQVVFAMLLPRFMKREIRHIPVLLKEVLELTKPKPGMFVVDCTLGLAGHARELLARIKPDGKLIGIDFDKRNITEARKKLDEVGGDYHLHHGNFAGLQQILAERGIWRVDAIVADLGVASPQIDDPSRGFSFRFDGPLDMRMDNSRGRPASVLINTLSERELTEVLLEYGDETDAPQIAKLIVQRRKRRPIETTRELMEIVCEARDFTLERARGAKLHPATRTFQALRILTNRELANLDNLLRILPSCLNPGGIACIISFHSGEDRRVKDAFKQGLEQRLYSEISPDPILPGEEETAANPRSRSAKLRWARRAAE